MAATFSMSLRAFLPRPEGRGLTRILIKVNPEQVSGDPSFANEKQRDFAMQIANAAVGAQD